MRPDHPLLDFVFESVGFDCDSYDWDGQIEKLGLINPHLVLNLVDVHLLAHMRGGAVSVIWRGIKLLAIHFEYGRKTVQLEELAGPGKGWGPPGPLISPNRAMDRVFTLLDEAIQKAS